MTFILIIGRMVMCTFYWTVFCDLVIMVRILKCVNTVYCTLAFWLIWSKIIFYNTHTIKM